MTGGRTSGHTAGGLWHEEVGDGPLVVLVHGSMDRSAGMLRVRRTLQDSCRVVRYDRRGYARSLATGPARSFAEQVDDLAAVLDGRPAVVAGHSYGGVVALGLAVRAPDLVQAVLAYEAPMPWESWWPRRALGGEGAVDPADVAEGFLRRMIGDRAWERLPAGVRAERRAEGPTFVAEIAAIGPDGVVPYRPEQVTVPVVAARGERSREHHERAAVELARRAPRGELAVVPGASHGAHLTHPGAFADLVRQAVARVGDRPSAC